MQLEFDSNHRGAHGGCVGEGIKKNSSRCSRRGRGMETKLEHCKIFLREIYTKWGRGNNTS